MSCNVFVLTCDQGVNVLCSPAQVNEQKGPASDPIETEKTKTLCNRAGIRRLFQQKQSRLILEFSSQAASMNGVDVRSIMAVLLHVG